MPIESSSNDVVSFAALRTLLEKKNTRGDRSVRLPVEVLELVKFVQKLKEPSVMPSFLPDPCPMDGAENAGSVKIVVLDPLLINTRCCCCFCLSLRI